MCVVRMYGMYCMHTAFAALKSAYWSFNESYFNYFGQLTFPGLIISVECDKNIDSFLHSSVSIHMYGATHFVTQ